MHPVQQKDKLNFLEVKVNISHFSADTTLLFKVSKTVIVYVLVYKHEKHL